MAYDKTDARAALPTAAAASIPSQIAGAEYLKFYELPPSHEAPGGKTWYGRAQNFVLVYSEVDGELEFERTAQPDEFAVLLPDPAVSAEFICGGDKLMVSGNSLIFVPPGDSTVRLRGKGRAIRLFSTRTEDLVAKAANAASYEHDHPNVALLKPWPDPVGGFKLRSYSLDAPTVPGTPIRLFRSTNFMINYLSPAPGPRDPAKMSPHSHDDFEQCSLVLGGQFDHHIRWPWSTDMGTWREDEHVSCTGTSMTVIPPPSIHTSQAVGIGDNHLIDIFSPPRVDFSQMSGWIINADEYPMPADAVAAQPVGN